MERLESNLSSKKYIERAKGILVDLFELREGEAVARLQKLSGDKNKKLAMIAKELIGKNRTILR